MWVWNVNVGVNVHDTSIIEGVVNIHVHLAQILDVGDMSVYVDFRLYICIINIRAQVHICTVGMKYMYKEIRVTMFHGLVVRMQM